MSKLGCSSSNCGQLFAVWTSAWLARDFLIDQGSQGSQETQGFLTIIIMSYIFYIKAISYHVTQSYELYLRKYSNVYIQNIDKEMYLWVKEI